MAATNSRNSWVAPARVVLIAVTVVWLFWLWFHAELRGIDVVPDAILDRLPIVVGIWIGIAPGVLGMVLIYRRTRRSQQGR